MKSFYFLFLLLLLGCEPDSRSAKLVFENYPNLKLGFTTQNFIECVDVNLENVLKFVDYAHETGFSWIELRDPDADLTVAECQQIAAHAKRKNVEIAYANQRGFLDKDFWDVFTRGLENAKVFTEGTGTIRTLISGHNFDDETKQGLTADELNNIVAIANKAAHLAEENRLQLIVENAAEPLKGDGKAIFGLGNFFAKVNKNVGWQFDTANFFSGARIKPKVNEAQAFFEANLNNLFYIHLKAAKNNQAQPYLVDNEMDFDVIFSLLAKHNVSYIAIELLAVDNEQEAYQNMDKSVDYLMEKGFVY